VGSLRERERSWVGFVLWEVLFWRGVWDVVFGYKALPGLGVGSFVGSGGG
jgi:hypothetical protein